MAIPEHDKCVKMKRIVRDIVKKEKNYYGLITNRNERLKYPVFIKHKMRKRIIWFVIHDRILTIATLRSKKLGFKRLVDYYKYMDGSHYRKWGKYKMLKRN